MHTEADSEMKLMNEINGSRMVFTCAYVSHLMASQKTLKGAPNSSFHFQYNPIIISINTTSGHQLKKIHWIKFFQVRYKMDPFITLHHHHPSPIIMYIP